MENGRFVDEALGPLCLKGTNKPFILCPQWMKTPFKPHSYPSNDNGDPAINNMHSTLPSPEKIAQISLLIQAPVPFFPSMTQQLISSGPYA